MALSPCQQLLILVFILATVFITIESFILWRLYKVGRTIVREYVTILDNTAICGAPGCEMYPCQDSYHDDLAFPNVPIAARSPFQVDTAFYLIDLITRVVMQSDLEVKNGGNQINAIPPPPQLSIFNQYRDIHRELLGTFYVTKMAYSSVLVGFFVWKGSSTRYQYGIDGDFSEIRSVILHHSEQQTPLYITQSPEFELRVDTHVEDQLQPCTAIQRPISVHAGFQEIYLQVRKKVLSDLATVKPDFLFICGHSLGGAISNLLGLDLLINDPVNMEIMTFGCPRIGSPEFCALFDQFRTRELLAFWTVENESDIVPLLPLPVMPNVLDLKKPNFFAHAGSPLRFDLNLGGISQNHVLNAYVAGLERRFQVSETADDETTYDEEEYT
jgi:hypothetical protein